MTFDPSRMTPAEKEAWYLAMRPRMDRIAQAFARKVHAPANPWGVGATTLEWTLPSPPPFHSYETLPRIK